MKNFDIEEFLKDLSKLFNDMQDKAIAGSENVSAASWVIKQQQSEIEQLKYDLAVNENYLLLERQYNEKLWKQLNPTGKAQEK